MIPFREQILTPVRPVVAALSGKTARRRCLLQVWEYLKNTLAADPLCRVEGLEFEIDVRSRLFLRILSEGSYEAAHFEIVRKHLSTSSDAIDVGANVGFFACVMADMLDGGRVLALEPTPGALCRLHKNIERNEVESSVIVFEGVAADKKGTLNLSYVEGQEEFSSLGGIDHPSLSDTRVKEMEVPSETLDTLVELHGLNPRFLKIDAEGAEFLVLKGALKTLEKFKPVILAELSDPLLKAKGSSAADVMQMLESLGYCVVDPFTGKRPRSSQFHGDMLAVVNSA